MLSRLSTGDQRRLAAWLAAKPTSARHGESLEFYAWLERLLLGLSGGK